MSKKSVLNEGRNIQLATQLIHFGARLQILESETTLSRERLLKLYKEIKGMSPPKGMLPYSADWFLTWQPNVHSSIFMNIYDFLIRNTSQEGIEAILKAYQLYLEQIQDHVEGEPVVSLTRAWTLVRFFDSGILKLSPCEKCGGHYVVNALDLLDGYVCGLCQVPSRAGKTKLAKQKDLIAA